MTQVKNPPKSGVFISTVASQAAVKFMEEIWPGVFNTQITLCELSYHPGCVRFDEIVFLAFIVAHLQPARVFEIGTCQGRTTLNLARNLNKVAKLYTLNLPSDDSCSVDWLQQDPMLYESSKNLIGERWKKHPCGNIITQLYGNSLHFDFSKYKDMDFLLIDGNKTKQYVASDSLNGWNMLRPGGTMMWHDYAYCDGVTTAVDEFASITDSTITHIYKTTLAVVRK